MKAHNTSSGIIHSTVRIVFGLLITAAGYQIFLTPHSISVGGLTGAAVIINKYLGIPCAATMLLLNISLFAWGWRVKGHAYILRTLAATLALGVLLDLDLPLLPALTPRSPLAALVIGSLLTGLGYGLIVSADTSTGGSDLLAAIVTQRLRFLTIGMVMDFIDLIVVAASAFCEGIKTLPASLAAVFACNALIDIAAYSFGSSEAPDWISRVWPEDPGRRRSPRRVKLRRIPWTVLAASVVFILIRAYAITTGISQQTLL